MPSPDASSQPSNYFQACQASGSEFGRQPAPSPEVLDAQLIQEALDGDFEAFGGLVSRYERKAFWMAFHVLGQVEEARDVVQEAFIRVYRSLDRFDFSKNFYTWLYRIVTNLAIDSLRKMKSTKTVHVGGLEEGAGLPAQYLGNGHGHDASPGRALESTELASDVRRILDGISPRFRTILALRDLHGISCRVMAPILGLTYATVRWRLHKARQIFRERWERESRQGSARPVQE